ncbi:MAG: chemotaxis response regulator protein-glutamate methylesterase [Nitrospirota bacterium]
MNRSPTADAPDRVIRVLVVEDSATTSRLLETFLNSDPQIAVVGVARNGRDATELVQKLRPDLVTMDINLPVMDGFEATKWIMAFQPTPILILSTRVYQGGRDNVFQAIAYGALDVVEKVPFVPGGDGAKELIEKVKRLSRVRVIRHPLAKLEQQRLELQIDAPPAGRRLVAIGASTGGPVAIFDVLRRLPAHFPASVAVVLHIAKGFTEGFVEWVRADCALRVQLARHGESLESGVVYVAPDDRHLRVVKPGLIHLSDDPPVQGHRPSVTALFESAADSYGSAAIGVLLTGMGRDGARGMQAIKERGGRTIAQDEQSSIIFGMPRAAIELGAVDRVLPLPDVAETLIRWMA